MAKNSATAAAPTSLAKRRQASTLKAAAVFLAPIFILIAIFIVYPIIDNFKTSFYQWNGISANKVWVGLDNWKKLLHDTRFWTAFYHNVIIDMYINFFTTV